MDMDLVNVIIAICIPISSAGFFIAYSKPHIFLKAAPSVRYFSLTGLVAGVAWYFGSSLVQMRLTRIAGDMMGIQFLNAVPEEGDLTKVFFEKIAAGGEPIIYVSLYGCAFFAYMLLLESILAWFAGHTILASDRSKESSKHEDT